MKDESIKKESNTNSYSRIKERASMLADSLNAIKERGIVVMPNEPIEGKMYWSNND